MVEERWVRGLVAGESGGGWGYGGEGSEAEALAAVFKHGLSAGGADAADADCADGEECVEVADAAGGLDLDAGWRVAAHEFEVSVGSASGGVTGGGLDPVDADLGADFAEVDFGGVVEIGVLKDDFDFLAGVVDELGEGGEFGLDVGPVAAAGFADIDDDVELLTAVGEGLAGFSELDGGGVSAVGEADGGAGVDVGAGEDLGAAGEGVGQDADAGYVVTEGQGAAVFKLRRGEGGVEQGVVNHLGDGEVVVRKRHDISPDASANRDRGANGILQEGPKCGWAWNWYTAECSARLKELSEVLP